MQYIDFFRALGPVIPCPSCAQHYMGYMEKHPIDADSRESLARWVYDLHEDVNKRSHKTGLTWEQVKSDYTGWNPERARELASASSRQKGLRQLADPHFGRPIQVRGGGSEAQQGKDPGASRGMMIFFAAFVIVVIAGWYKRRVAMRKKKQEEDEAMMTKAD